MTTLHTLLVNAHIVVGAVALVLFWIPAFSRKGSTLHVQSGRFYAYAMYFVSVSAFLSSVMVLADPIGIRRPGLEMDPEDAVELAELFRMFSLFLLMLSVLVFASIRHGLAALRVRQQPDAIKSRLHRGMLLTLGALGIVVLGIGLADTRWLLIIFGGISISGAIGMFRDTRIEQFTRGQQLKAHLSGLIGSGIGAYTAFFAFGGSRLFAELLPGQWQVVSWVVAPVIGTIAIQRLSRRYQRGRA